MARHHGPVLVDTNVILECWRLGAWRALTGGYGVETVEDCVIETQTGFQRRRRQQRIDQAALQASLAAVHKVAHAQRAAAVVRDALFTYLDPAGSPWAHALTRADAGCCAGPTRRACVLACGKQCATASWRWKPYCRTWDIERPG